MGKIGLVPRDFLEIYQDLPSASPAAKPAGGKPSATGLAEAVFDYDDGDASTDLHFKAGQKITLVERISDEWLRGELGGRSGMFPVAFVKIVKDIP